MRLFSKIAVLILMSFTLTGCFITTDQLVVKNSPLTVPVGNFYISEEKRTLLIDLQKSGGYLVKYNAFELNKLILATEYMRGSCKAAKTEDEYVSFHIDFFTRNKIKDISKILSDKNSEKYKKAVNELRAHYAKESAGFLKSCPQVTEYVEQLTNRAKRETVYKTVLSVNAVELKTQKSGIWILAQISKVIENNKLPELIDFKLFQPTFKENALIIGKVENKTLKLYSTSGCKKYLPKDQNNVINALTKCIDDGGLKGETTETFTVLF